MSRSVRLVPALASLLVLALTGTACDAGVRGAPGGSGVGDPYFPKAGNGGYDVGHYSLALDYTPANRRLTGTAVITARATRDLSAFDLDLAGLHVESVDVEGEKARWNRTGQELTVRPHTDLSKGETFRATVRYSGTPRTLTDPDGSKEGWLPTADGALALGEPVGSMTWFPGNHHPSDKATYDIAVTVPQGLKAVSVGEQTDQTSKGGRTTYRWQSAQPMSSYLATVAVGRFDIARTTGPHGLPVVTAVDPRQARVSAGVLARIPEILDWAETNFGPYPFSSAGAIVDRPGDAGYALETQTRPVFPGPPDVSTLVHELVHQWYGDSVGPASWRDMWLNEGFATYAEWLYDEDHDGPTAQETFTSLYEDGPDDLWAFPPARPTSAAHISDAPVYQRGAMVVHKIRQTVGDDTFYDIVQGWAAAHRHGTADTADFVRYVERKAPGKDFRTIWKDWLYGDGKPAHA
ncbi:MULTISPECIES: M1 family metallopeptidase [Streptomyces]|uniref:M1 family metallopeptidase n=1 Tax=Streptomyces TaxID=1883 RepID=UPI001672FF03|nr:MULTISPECIES: M1 family metallopeptidase [Streptomyces]MBK3526673.1 M1 family metallopeptidase [Streptomyces sp. MBT70]GGR60938.1 metallopeptidase [Streptomyces eurythermus]